MQAIKRDGTEVRFDINKIINAIRRANSEVERRNQISAEDIKGVANNVNQTCKQYGRVISVEEIQNLVEEQLMSLNHEIARKYIRYRYQHELDRKKNTTDTRIISVVNLKNKEVLEENSNKDPIVIPTQRDYIAGEISKDLTDRYLLPREISEAHKAGIIHFHDSDYFIQHSHNCDLVNLEDMLQNGTVINKTKIEKPHSFATACNVATQIMAQVASCQYGGQTISLSHLAPFVNISRQKIRSEVEMEIAMFPLTISFDRIKDLEEYIKSVTEKRLRQEIKREIGRAHV